jgi:CheY-like chemotaxis protein
MPYNATTGFVVLPVGTRRADKNNEQESQCFTTLTHRERAMRLLCVEDETSLREDIAEYLRLKSYEVDEAETGEDAVERLQSREYDLVLCDIKMPRMDGYELLRQVRSDNHHIKTPFIFLSALSERDDRIRAHDTGCDGYLTKPIDFSVLDATLRSAIGRQRARDFENNSRMECAQRHIMAAIDDALSGPVSDAALAVQHLRDTLPLLTPQAFDNHLIHLQRDLCAHMNQLHTFYSVMQLQLDALQLIPEDKAFADIVRDAMEECHFYYPSAPVRTEALPQLGPTVRADMRMLQRALGGLIAMVPRARPLADVVQCIRAGSNARITVSDQDGMEEDVDFMKVDSTANLAALSTVTRQRLIAIAYAIQVAEAHGGSLEIKLWPNDQFAARFVLPQPDEVLSALH